MEIIIGKTAGFCFGVKNAVTKAEEALEQNEEIYCLGELVHNKQVTERLTQKGMHFIDNITEAKGKTVIRSHGVEKKTYKQAENIKIDLIDLTCPKVLHIHNIAEEYAKKGFYIILTGDENHPEMLGTASFCGDHYYILEDEENIEKAIDEFKKSNGIDLKTDKMAMQRLKEAAEKSKIELSSTPTSQINLPFITADATGPKHLDLTLTQAKFNELTSDLVQSTMGPVKQALSDSGLSASDLHKVLMVGGSSRIPAVQEAVKSFMNKDPFKGINPDECVALGAAYQGGVLGGDVKEGLLLLDVTPLTLGIETAGGVSTPMIQRNTTIPTKQTQVFSTYADNQTAVDINVLQGEREFAKDNKQLGTFRLDGIAPAPRGIPQIEVTFDIDANGIVNVSAKDLGTGKEQHITITAGSNMSDDEIDKAVKEAAEYEAQDKKRKEAIDTRNDADSFVFQTEKALNEVGDKIDASQKSEVEADIAAVKAVLDRTKDQEMSDSDIDELKAAKEKLTNSAQALFTKMYENMQQAQGAAGPDMSGMGGQAGSDMGAQSGPADDVVDGDYREV